MAIGNLIGQGAEVSKAFRWVLVAPALLLPFFGSCFYFYFLHGTTTANFLYSGVKVFTVVYPLVCALWILRIPLPFQGSFASHLRALPAGLALGGAIVGFALVLLQTPLGTLVEGSADQMRAHLGGTIWLKYYVPLAVALSVVHLLVEEFYWRWFVYGQLRNLLPRGWALVIGGVGFTLHHVVVLMQFFDPPIALIFSACVGIGGVFWSLMMDRQKTLAGAWISHMVVDFGMFGIGYWLLF